MEYTVIPLFSSPESTYTVPLDSSVVVKVTTRYNYSAACWTLDLHDSLGAAILTGLMLIPDIDILKPYPQVKKTLGSMVLIEKSAGEYQKTTVLGATAKLLWFAPDAEIVLP